MAYTYLLPQSRKAQKGGATRAGLFSRQTLFFLQRGYRFYFLFTLRERVVLMESETNTIQFARRKNAGK